MSLRAFGAFVGRGDSDAMEVEGVVPSFRFGGECGDCSGEDWNGRVRWAVQLLLLVRTDLNLWGLFVDLVVF